MNDFFPLQRTGGPSLRR